MDGEQWIFFRFFHLFYLLMFSKDGVSFCCFFFVCCSLIGTFCSFRVPIDRVDFFPQHGGFHLILESTTWCCTTPLAISELREEDLF